MAVSSLAVDELRSHLNTFIQSLKHGATTSEIIADFRRSYANSISKAQIELEDMGLTKLINSVGMRRPTNHPGELDLFSGFSVPNTIVVRDEEGRAIHVPIGKVSISEAKNWAHSPRRPSQQTAHQIEVQRLIEEIEPYASDGDTSIEFALLASKADSDEEKDVGT